MGNWEPAAHTERVQVGNPPPKIARAVLLLDRRDVYEQQERDKLIALPEEPYRLASWSKAKVNIDYHVTVDRHHYSVPYRYVQREVEVRRTESTVEVCCEAHRIAAHVRSWPFGIGHRHQQQVQRQRLGPAAADMSIANQALIHPTELRRHLSPTPRTQKRFDPHRHLLGD